MKLKLADGTEVEIDDNDPVAIAASEHEKAVGLGFASVADYHNSLSAEVDKLKNQTKADQEFIDRQKNELGALRKLSSSGEEEDKEHGEPVKKEETEETPESRETRYAEMNQAIQDNLTDDERKHAEDEFVKLYNESTPQQRAMLKTAEGRNAFLGMVMPEKETSDTPVSLFAKPQPKPKSIGEQVREALVKDVTGTSSRPVTSRPSGTGYREGRQAPNVAKKVARPLINSGGVLEAVNQLEAQQQ